MPVFRRSSIYTDMLRRLAAILCYWPSIDLAARRSLRRSSMTYRQCLSSVSCPVVICSDFNIHVDQVDHVNAVRLSQLLQSFGYIPRLRNDLYCVEWDVKP